MIAQALDNFGDLPAYQQRRAVLGILGIIWIAILLGVFA